MEKRMIKENENNNKKFLEGLSNDQYERGLIALHGYFGNNDQSSMTESNAGNNKLEYFTE